MLLGGLVLLGVQPGPSMIGENLPVTLSIVWTLALANVVGRRRLRAARGPPWRC